MSKYQISWLKLAAHLIFSVTICWLLWLDEQSERVLLAQPPIPGLNIIIDEVEIVSPPRLPTATPTRIPDDEPPVTALVVGQSANNHN